MGTGKILMLLTICFLITSSGCAALKAGWVKTQFMQGKVAQVMVCQMKIGKQGDIEAKCVDLNTIQAEIRAEQERQRKAHEPQM